MRKFCASGVLEHCLIHNPIMIYWSTDACWLMYLKWLLLGGAFFVWRVLHTRHIFNYLNRCISMEHVGHGCNFPASVFGRNSNFGFSIHGVNLAIIAFGCSLVWMKDTQVIYVQNYLCWIYLVQNVFPFQIKNLWVDSIAISLFTIFEFVNLWIGQVSELPS